MIWPKLVAVGCSDPEDCPVGVISQTDIRPPGVAVEKTGTVGVEPVPRGPTTSPRPLHASAAIHSAINANAAIQRCCTGRIVRMEASITRANGADRIRLTRTRSEPNLFTVGYWLTPDITRNSYDG